MSDKATPEILDFSNVKSRGAYNPKNIDPGDYAAKISAVVSTKAKDGEPMWVFTFVLDEVPRATYPYYCKLVENQLFKVLNLCKAAGVTSVEGKKVKLDPNKLVGKKVGVSVEDDEYEGRMKSVIAEIFDVDDIGQDDEEDDEPTPEPVAKKTKPAAKTKPEPVAEEEEDEDLEELEIDEV